MEKELLQIFKQHVTFLNNQLQHYTTPEFHENYVRNMESYNELTVNEAKLAYESGLHIVEMSKIDDYHGRNVGLYNFKEISSSEKLNSYDQKTHKLTIDPNYQKIQHPLKKDGVYLETYNLLRDLSEENNEQFVSIIQESLLDDFFGGDVAQIQSRIQEILYENELPIALNTPNDYLFIKDSDNKILNITDSISYLNETYKNNSNIISKDDLNDLINQMEKLNSLKQLDTKKSLKQYLFVQNIENGSLKRGIQERVKDATQNLKDNDNISKDKNLEKPLADIGER